MKKNLITLAAICSLAGSATAATVILDDSQSAAGATTGTNTLTITTAGFDATASDKLVVGFGGRTATAAITGVTYNGVALVLGDDIQRTQGFAAIYYLDNVASNGNLVFTFNANVNDTWAYGLFALSNTKDGGPFASANSGTDNLATTTLAGVDGGFVINATAIRGNSVLTTTPTATGLFNVGNSRGGGAYWTNTSAATNYISSIGGAGQSNTNNVGLTVSFEAIPEPSSAALFGLGALALIARRRR